MRVPSTTGSSPSWSSHPAREASRWCSRPQAAARAVPYRAGLGDGGRRRGGPGTAVGELERGPVPQRAAVGAGQPGRGGEVHHPVAAQPAQHLDRQVGQQPGQPGQVIAGVEHDQDVRVAVTPVPGGDDPGHHLADLGGGHLGRVIGRAEPDRIQRQRPRGAARLQRRDQRVRPARDHLRVPLPPRITVAEQPLRAGGRVRPQPVAHIHRQPDPPVRPGRQRQARQRPAQPRDLHLAARSPRHRPRRGRGGTPAPATAPPACAPGPACTAPHRPVRTAHPGACPGTGTARRGTPPASRAPAPAHPGPPQPARPY